MCVCVYVFTCVCVHMSTGPLGTRRGAGAGVMGACEPPVTVRIRTAPMAHIFECLITKEWYPLIGLEVWLCWRKCVNGSGALRFQKRKPGPLSSPLCLPMDQDVTLSPSACMYATMLPVMMIMD